jgi:hypothetical protein
MKPDRDLIKSLQHIDSRILYLEFGIFDEKKQDSSQVQDYMKKMYKGSNLELGYRGVTLYLSESGDMPFSKEKKMTYRSHVCSPIKSIIKTCQDGTARKNTAGFNLSLDVTDLMSKWHGEDSVKDFRDIFPEKSNLIYPGILVYNLENLYLGDDDGYYVKDLSRLKCIVNAIIFDM